MPADLHDELLWALSLERLNPVLQRPETVEGATIAWAEKSVGVQDTAFPVRSGIERRFVVTDSPLINGRAWTRKIDENLQLRISTVTAGAILGPPHFFHYLMSRTDVLPDIGFGGDLNVSEVFEISPRYPMVGSPDAGVVATIPTDPIRREFAEIMSRAWGMFITTHELAHSLCGHTVIDPLGFAEIAKPSGGTIARHTLEMSADSIAAGNALERMLLGGHTDHLWSPAHEGHLQNRFYYPFMLALSLMLRAMSGDDLSPKSWADSFHGSHPHFSYRRHMMAITCGRILARFFPGVGNLEEAAANLSVKANIDAHTIWCSITGKQEPRNFWMFGDNYEKIVNGFDQARRYQELLLEEWKTLRPRLEPHAIWQLPPSE